MTFHVRDLDDLQLVTGALARIDTCLTTCRIGGELLEAERMLEELSSRMKRNPLDELTQLGQEFQGDKMDVESDVPARCCVAGEKPKVDYDGS